MSGEQMQDSALDSEEAGLCARVSYRQLLPSEPPPLLFLPPPVSLPPTKQHLASTQDLLARFSLLPAYDRYVRPFVQLQSQPEASSSTSIPNTNTNALASGSGSGNGTEHGGAGYTNTATGQFLPRLDTHMTSSPAPTPGSTSALDKGKAREVPSVGGGMSLGDTSGDLPDGGDGDDDEAGGVKGEKKKKNSYKHLIRGVPGKHSYKKDDYLTNIMLVPPKQRMRLSRFDARTQEDAFTVSLEGLKGWNINALVVESAQAREDRKKRKELKKLAKLAQQTGTLPPGTSPTTTTAPSLPPGVAHPQPIQAPIPTPGSVQRALTPQAGIGTPRAGGVATSRPGSTVHPHPPSNNHAAGAGTAPPTGGSGSAVRGTSGTNIPRVTSAVPRPGSAVPRPGSAAAAGGPLMSVPKQQVGTPVRVGTPMQVDPPGSRGKKREREKEDGGGSVNGVNGVGGHATNGGGIATTNGHGHGNGHRVGAGPGQVNGQKGVVNGASTNAKAGTGSIRPRPLKKQRMDVQGQARDVAAPVQQPTPQGV